MSDYIPSELIPNILARLAVDDVLRCTSVCKSWYSLITSPSFASLHLNLSSPNQEPRLLIRSFDENSRVSFCLHRDNQTIDEIAVLDHSFGRKWRVIDCLNGLVCLHDMSENTIVLWNPSLKKSHILPKPRVLSEYNVGFGFVAASNEYKIVRYSYRNKPHAQIYELSIGFWRNLKLGNYSFGSGKFRQVHLNGILHWYSVNSEKFKTTFSNMICSFDMKTEKFGAFMVPDGVSLNYHEFLIPFTSSESLYLLDYAVRGKSIKIWKMKEYGISNSWEKVVIIDKQQYDITNIPYLRHNGEVLICITSTGEAKLFSYSFTNKQVEYNVLELANAPLKWTGFYVNTYVDSLVLIKCPDEVMKSRLMKNRVSRSGLLLN